MCECVVMRVWDTYYNETNSRKDDERKKREMNERKIYTHTC